ncbi:MAG: tetratricopeptide repeat protein [Verrucomicrobiota bacterium]
MFHSRVYREQRTSGDGLAMPALEVDASIEAFRGGDVQKAIETARKVCEAYPDHVDGWMMLGVYLKEAKRWQEAEACLMQSMRLEPSNPSVHNNLGNLLKLLGRLDEAENRYRRACRLAPEELDYQLNLGRHLMIQGKEDEGLGLLQEASRQHNQRWECKHALGIAYLQFFALEKAEACFRQVLELNPANAEAYANLGSSLVCQNRHHEAKQVLEQAIGINPFLPQPYWNLSIIFLREGNYENGWGFHEWRRKLPGYLERVDPLKEWNGRDLKDRTLLLRAEQGLGDTLQFIRYLPLAKKRVGKLILECQAELVDLLADFSGVDEIVERDGQCIVYDEALPLLSLPWVLGLKNEFREEAVPYLGCYNKKNIAGKFRVGLAWSGSKQHAQDSLRSCQLGELEELRAIEDIEWVCLQKDGAQELESMNWPMEVSSLDNFQITRSVLENLDLLITVDTSVAHLAGAIGMPVWNLIQYSPDWRWGMNADKTCWYPGMRLFRQKVFRDWSQTIHEVASSLKNEIQQRVRE